MIDLTKPWPPGLNRDTWLLFLLGFVVALLLVSQVDVWASRGAIGWPEAWRAPFFAITDYGVSDWVLIPSLALFLIAVFAGHFLRGLKRLAAYEVSMLAGYIFVGVGLPGLVANLIKRVIGRGRPDMFEEFGAYSFHNVVNDWTFQSFPSGHATTAIGIAFTVGFLAPRLFLWLLAAGIFVAISRVPVGMHYPSDVFGGACLGLIGAYVVRYFFARRRWMFKFRPDNHIVTRPLCAIRRLYQRARA
ncbi:MAG: phosphatase family protein [Devosia sp.]|uniref:phosphatase PAP2 family protein n=1 Tax=Devosia sp. TaxID=1871048 RepID=UPI00262FCE64|nr:phosphatase PAP2 family protein [Devosia sp.]MDB5588599.1 phosphatase family protein [Devosia sp.]